MIIRPKCKRCLIPLDLFSDEDGVRWTCSTFKRIDGKISRPMYTDKEFEAIWNSLSGDDVVRLEKELGEPVWVWVCDLCK